MNTFEITKPYPSKSLILWCDHKFSGYWADAQSGFVGCKTWCNGESNPGYAFLGKPVAAVRELIRA